MNLKYRLKGMMSHSKETDNTLSKEQIIAEARSLCSDYIDDRLIRSGLNLKQRKITTQASGHKNSTSEMDSLSLSINMTVKPEKIASLEAFRVLSEKRNASGGCTLTIDDLSKVLLYVGEVLELRHTYVYTDVLQQLNVRSLTDVNLRRLFTNVAKEIFSEGIDWARIVSFIAFAGALAADCVLSGSSIHIPRIKIWTVEYIENELLDWIYANGGWIGFFDHFTLQQHHKRTTPPLIWTVSAIVLLLGIIIVAFYTLVWKTTS